MKLTTYDLVLCALCAAVTCILAPLSVPLAGEVPVSLATFAVLLSGILLGAKLGGLSQLIYVLLGSVGVPGYPLRKLGADPFSRTPYTGAAA